LRAVIRDAVVVVSVILLAVSTTLYLKFVWFPEQNLKYLRDFYLRIMANLNSSGVKHNMTAQLDYDYNFTELLVWEGNRLIFAPNLAGRVEDPMQILESGIGKCGEFSIVYVSACLALGYQARIVVATNTTSWVDAYLWAEAYYNDGWVHVDPTTQVWNKPSMYQYQPWSKGIGQDIKIYAFEDGKCEDVTQHYENK
jgi:Transglutaminase-like superfamily